MSQQTILVISSVVSTSVPVHGFTQLASGLILLGRLHLRPLQQQFHTLGLTNRFTPPRRSDQSVLAPWTYQDLSFLTSGIPVRLFQADFTIFTDAATQGWGAHMGNSQISGILDPLRQQAPYCSELKAVISTLQH